MRFVAVAEAASQLGIHVDTLRAWEEKGLINPHRTPGGHRRYNVKEIKNMMDHPSPLLTQAERQILVNQYLILSEITKSDDYDDKIEALQMGYESEYGLDQIDEDVLSLEGCREVRQILQLYWLIQRIAPDKSFPGFDSIQESAQAGYARFLIHKQKRFDGIKTDWHDCTSSCASRIFEYREMLTAVEMARAITPEEIFACVSTML